MNIKIAQFVLLILGMLSLHAEQSLTIYSYRHYESDDALFKQFTQKTGIEINVVKAKADALLERLKAEGKKTPADILITSDAGRLYMAKEAGLLQAVDSEALQTRIPSNLRDVDNHWFGFTQRARVVVYAPDRVKPDELSTYENLANPEWRGRLIARSSSNIYNQSLLASIIETDGEKAALNWAKQVRKNMARPPQGSDRDQMRAVYKGLADAAIVNTYYVGLLQNSKDKKDRDVGNGLKVFFPNQSGRGTHVNISGAGMVGASKKMEEATAFLEFLASDAAQKTFPAETSEYPVIQGIGWSKEQLAWGQFKADSINLGKLGERNAEAVRLFNLAGWE